MSAEALRRCPDAIKELSRDIDILIWARSSGFRSGTSRGLPRTPQRVLAGNPRRGEAGI